MKTLWTLAKLVLTLAVVVPLSIIVLAVALGIFGAVVGIAFFALKIAFFGLIVYGLFRLAANLLGGRKQPSQPEPLRELPPVDPHYEAAMRELDQELGGVPR